MKIIVRRTKLWSLWNLLFRDADLERICIAFGDIIFAPNRDIAQDLIVHEMTHMRQHRSSYVVAFVWWIRYIFSKKFRYSQELEAYAEQLKYVDNLARQIKDINKRFKYHHDMKTALAGILSSPMYGDMVEYSVALKDLGAMVPWIK